MDDTDGLGLAHACPSLVPVAAEKARLVPHPPQVKASQGVRAFGSYAIQGYYRIQPGLYPTLVLGHTFLDIPQAETSEAVGQYQEEEGHQKKGKVMLLHFSPGRPGKGPEGCLVVAHPTVRGPARGSPQMAAPSYLAISTKPWSSSDQAKRAASTTWPPSMPTTSCCTGYAGPSPQGLVATSLSVSEK